MTKGQKFAAWLDGWIDGMQGGGDYCLEISSSEVDILRDKIKEVLDDDGNTTSSPTSVPFVINPIPYNPGGGSGPFPYGPTVHHIQQS
jgi:hypothetical protein